MRQHMDRAEAERLVNAYSDLILRLSYTYLKSTEDAKDICQTVFLKLLEKPREFDSPEHERAWIIRAAVNQCKDQLKSRWRRTTVDLEATLDAVTISPLSIQVDYTVREQFQLEDQENGKMSASNSAQVKKFLSSLPISVNFTDGTSRDLDYLGGSLDPEGDRTVCQKGGVFGEILDLSTVESVTVGGVTLPVEAE